MKIKYSYFPGFDDEKIHIKIYDSDGVVVGTSDQQMDNYWSNYWGEDIKTYTINWDTKGCKAGEYKVVATTEFYSDFSWNETPESEISYITLKEKSKNTVKKSNYKVKIKSAINVKGKKIKVSWKKISKAKKYKISIGSKKYTTKKLSYTSKKLKKGKSYKVKVRAYVNGKYQSWSKTKTVTIRK